MLRPDEPIVQIQRVEHESRVHIDIETDDIPAEVTRLEQLGAVVVGLVASGKGNFGYNVATGEYEDLVKAGVVDPTMVTRTALHKAVSIAGVLLTTECLIT